MQSFTNIGQIYCKYCYNSAANYLIISSPLRFKRLPSVTRHMKDVNSRSNTNIFIRMRRCHPLKWELSKQQNYQVFLKINNSFDFIEFI